MVITIAILSAGRNERWRQYGKDAKKALDGLSYNAVEIDVDGNIAAKLKKVNPTLAFVTSFFETPFYDNGIIQGLLETLGIRYTHSGVSASATASNKVIAKLVYQSIGIDTPKGHGVTREDILNDNIEMPYPYVLKPIDEGVSRGVHVIFSHDDYLKLINDPCEIRERMIVEEYIPGVDLTTTVLLDEAIGTMEIRTKNRFLDGDAKTDFPELVFPAEVPKSIREMASVFALKAHKFLGCKTLSRSDFRYDPAKNTLKMLELNTHPNLSELSFVSKTAKLAKNIDYSDLMKLIVEDSLNLTHVAQ